MLARRTLLALACLTLGGGCGFGGAQDRPEVVATSPAAGAPAAGPLGALRITYDEPVRLLSAGQLHVARDGALVSLVLYALPGEPDSVRARPASAPGFAPGTYDVEVRPGLVVDVDDHYTLEPYRFQFTIGPSTVSLFAASPSQGSVTELDPLTFAVRSTTLNAPGSTVQALAAVATPAGTRVVAQLTHGGGTGRALALYDAGDAAMATVPLTTSGGDLLAPHPCLALAPEGDLAYAAFRDASAQRVRLARVRLSDGAETGTLLLSPAADVVCAPTFLEAIDAGATLLLLVDHGGGARLCRVDRATFTELDRDGATPGVQGLLLGGPAGPGAGVGTTLAFGRGAATADVALADVVTDALVESPSTVPGVIRAAAATPDGSHLVLGLAGGTPDEHLAVRAAADVATDAPFALSDDVGGVDQGAGEVRDLVVGDVATWVLLDQDVLARLVVVGGVLLQDDLDAGTTGIQAVLLPAAAAGATRLGVVSALFP